MTPERERLVRAVSLLKISDEPLCYVEVRGMFQRACLIDVLKKAAAYDAAHKGETDETA